MTRSPTSPVDPFDDDAFGEIDAAVAAKSKSRRANSMDDVVAHVGRKLDIIAMRGAAVDALDAANRAQQAADENRARFDRAHRDYEAVRRVIGWRVLLGEQERILASLRGGHDPAATAFDVPENDYLAMRWTLELLAREVEECRPAAGNADMFKRAFVRFLANAWRQHVGEPGRGKSGPFVQFVEAAWRVHELPADELDSLGPFIRALAVRENWVGSRAKNSG